MRSILKGMRRAGLALAMLLCLDARAATYVVTSLNDTGAGSLREAISKANSNPGADTINFGAGLQGTITLTSNHIFISDALTINGPGASLLTISGGGNYRIFYIDNPFPQPVLPATGPDFVVSLSGLTLSSGRTATGHGGAILSYKSLTLSGMALSGNQSLRGGALAYYPENDGALAVTSSTLSNNTAVDTTSASSGYGGAINTGTRGGLASGTRASLTISDSRIENNVSDNSGGGLNLSTLGLTTVLRTSIVGNQVKAMTAFANNRNGGGLVFVKGRLLMDGSTVSGNVAANNAGGIELVQYDPNLQTAATVSSVTIANSTISGNVANATGGGIQLYGNVNLLLSGSSVTGNTAQANKTGGILIGTGPTTPESGGSVVDAQLNIASSTVANNQTGTGTQPLDIGRFTTFTTPSTTVTINNSTYARIGPYLVVNGSGNTVSYYRAVVTLSGSGSVTSNPADIECGVTCSANFAAGSTVTLTATAASGNYFAGWSGACSGTGACMLTMDAAKRATANFKAMPFAVKPTIIVTSTSATMATQIAFNPADVGKSGAVFVTGWVPVGSLATLGISNPDASLIVTRTPDNPNAAGIAGLRISQGTLAETDSSSFVLVQLTASGWQLVVNGQLVPYASGVLGDALAAQSILNNAAASTLTGAQFCVGYGASATEMLASGRMLPVASIAEPTNTGSCNVAASAPPSPYTGLFWNANESGWGMSVTQHGSMIFVAWYVYDAAGKPTWYVMSSCPLVGKTCTGDMYSVTGGTPLGVIWNGSGKLVNKVGSGTLTFTDNDTATFNYTLNGVAAVENITRQRFATGTSAPLVDYSELWWNADESGWGVALAQQYGMIFAAIYTYDSSGNAIWYVASSCPVVGNGCNGALYQVTGGLAPTAAWNPNLVVSQVGTVSFVFTDGSIGSMNVTINGVTTSRAITRQPF
jgi:hypothetical protein